MRRAQVIAIGLGLLLGTASFAGGGTADLAWHDIQGKAQSLDSYKGKIVVLNFWVTWCVPYQREMPLLAEMQRKYEEKGVVVVGASVDDEKSQNLIQPFAERNKIAFPLLQGASTDPMQKL